MPAAFLLVFLAFPLSTVMMRVGPSLHVAAGTLQVLGLSTLQAATSTVLSIAIGLPLASAVTRYRFRGRALAQALLTVPFVMPTVVVALAFRSMAGTSVPQGMPLVILAHAYVNLAVVVRVVGSTWSQMDDGYEKVARSLGASRLRAFVTVTLPILRGSILASAAIVFTFSFTSLGIALLLGDSSTRTLESQVLRQAGTLLDFPGAATTALLQLIVVVAVLAVGGLLSTRSPRGRLRPPVLRPLPSPRWTIPMQAAIGAAIVLAPVVALIYASVHSTHGWTLEWWRSLGSVDAGTDRIGSPVSALATSVGYACVTAVVAGLVGGCAAVAVLARGRRRVMAMVAMAPLGVSAATLGLGTLLAFGRPPFDLRGTGLLRGRARTAGGRSASRAGGGEPGCGADTSILGGIWTGVACGLPRCRWACRRSVARRIRGRVVSGPRRNSHGAHSNRSIAIAAGRTVIRGRRCACGGAHRTDPHPDSCD